jgi:serine/threonine protein kinase
VQAIVSGKVSFDICQLSKNGQFQNLEMESTKTGSPTTIFFARLVKEAIRQKSDVHVALKIFLDVPSSHEKKLLYEVEVYRNIIDKIVARGYSPNFIPFLGFGRCSIKNINNLIGNISTYFRDEYQIEFAKNPNLKVNVLMTEQPSGEIVSLASAMKEWSLTEEELEKIVLQLVYSLNVLQKFRTTHNDLHYHNVLLSKKSQLQKMYLIIGNRIFQFRTRYVPYIFDWDRSYSEPLGHNIGLTEDECNIAATCNRFSKRVDLYTLFCTFKNSIPEGRLLDYFKATYYTKIFQLSTDSTSSKIQVSAEELEQLLKYRPTHGNAYKLSSLQLKTLLPSLAKKLGKKITSITLRITPNGLVDVKELFYCRPSTFDSTYPTPEEMLLFEGEWTKHVESFDIFSKYEVDSIEEKGWEVYQTPKEITSAIEIYPEKSTRSKIIGKPRFPRRIERAYVRSEGKEEKFLTHYQNPYQTALLNTIFFSELKKERILFPTRVSIFDWLYNFSIDNYIEYVVLFQTIAMFDGIISHYNFNTDNLQGLLIAILILSEQIYSIKNSIPINIYIAVTEFRYTESDLYGMVAELNSLPGILQPLGTIYVYVAKKSKEIDTSDLIKLVYTMMNLTAYNANSKIANEMNSEKAAEKFIADSSFLTRVKISGQENQEIYNFWYTKANS